MMNAEPSHKRIRDSATDDSPTAAAKKWRAVWMANDGTFLPATAKKQEEVEPSDDKEVRTLHVPN